MHEGPYSKLMTHTLMVYFSEAKNLGVKGGHWRGRAGLRCARAKLGVDVELPPSPRTVRVVKQGCMGHCRDAECKWFAIVLF